MAGLLRDRSFVGYAFAGGLTFGALFAYLSGSSFVLQQIYGLSPQLYSLTFALNGLGLIAASQVNARIVERVGPTRLLRRGLGFVVASALTLLVVVSVGGLSVWAVLVPMFVIVSSLAFVLPNSTALALADHADVAGTASACSASSSSSSARSRRRWSAWRGRTRRCRWASSWRSSRSAR